MTQRLVFSLIIFVAWVGDARAAVITVDESCTLVDAIHAANRDAAVGACRAGEGADEIHLTVDVGLDAIDHIVGFNTAVGLPAIETEVTLVGNDHVVQRQRGAPPMSLFHLDLGGDLHIVSTVVAGASAEAIVQHQTAPLALTNTTFADNRGSVATEWGFTFEHAPVSVRNSQFLDSFGLYVAGDVTIRDSMFHRGSNFSELVEVSDNVTISNSSFSENRSSLFGEEDLILRNVTISGSGSAGMQTERYTSARVEGVTIHGSRFEGLFLEDGYYGPPTSPWATRSSPRTLRRTVGER